MSTLAIFVVAGIVVVVAVAAAFLIGLREADDPDQSQPEDLSSLERSLVDRSADDEAEDKDESS